MNDFNSVNKRPNLIKQYSLKANSNGQFANEPMNFNNANQNNNSNKAMNRTNRNSKECSISSGYLSSGGSNNIFANDSNRNKHLQQQRTIINNNSQLTTACQDKQVQTSIYEQQQQQNLDYNNQQQPILINELPPTHNSSIYVYYPNYSLPDLAFLNGSFQKYSSIAN